MCQYSLFFLQKQNAWLGEGILHFDDRINYVGWINLLEVHDLSII